MKRFVLTCGLLGLVATVQAQTVSGSADSRTNGSARVNQTQVSSGSQQETRASVKRQGKQAEVKAESRQRTDANASQGQESGLNLDAGTQLNAVLQSPLDSKRAADGDQFVMKTTRDVKQNGQTVIKKGSKLVGHVVRAQSKAEGQGQSSLTLVVDELQQGGQSIPLRATFVGVVQQAAQSSLDSDLGAPMSAPSAPRRSSGGGLLGGGGGGGLLGGATGAVGGAVSATTNTVGSVTGSVGGEGIGGAVTNTVNGSASGKAGAGEAVGGTLGGVGRTLFTLSNGVTATASGAASGATQFTRQGKDLKLDQGTEFVLSVAGGAQTSATAGRP